MPNSKDQLVTRPMETDWKDQQYWISHFFNIKKMAANARSAQCILGKTESLILFSSKLKIWRSRVDSKYTLEKLL